jgi:hypothetical protein
VLEVAPESGLAGINRDNVPSDSVSSRLFSSRSGQTAPAAVGPGDTGGRAAEDAPLQAVDGAVDADRSVLAGDTS